MTFLCIKNKSHQLKRQENNTIQPEMIPQIPIYDIPVIQNRPSKPKSTNMSLTTNPAYHPSQD